MTAQLSFYRCSLCQTVASSPVPGRYDCLACGRWMGFLYSTAILTDEQRTLAASGLVFSPYKVEPQPWDCVRCGQTFTLRPRYRTDGKYCQDCVNAEVHPPLRTPEQIAAGEARRNRLITDDQARMDAAYAAQEKQ